MSDPARLESAWLFSLPMIRALSPGERRKRRLRGGSVLLLLHTSNPLPLLGRQVVPTKAHPTAARRTARFVPHSRSQVIPPGSSAGLGGGGERAEELRQSRAAAAVAAAGKPVTSKQGSSGLPESGRGSGSGSAGFCLGPASPFHSACGRGRLLPVTKNRRRGGRERDGGEGGAGGSTGGEGTPPRRPGKLHGRKRAHRHWVPRTGQGAVPGSKRETWIKAGAWHYLFLEC